MIRGWEVIGKMENLSREQKEIFMKVCFCLPSPAIEKEFVEQIEIINNYLKGVDYDN